MYLLLSLEVAGVLTHHEYGGGGSGMPDITVEPSGSVITITPTDLTILYVTKCWSRQQVILGQPTWRIRQLLLSFTISRGLWRMERERERERHHGQCDTFFPHEKILLKACWLLPYIHAFLANSQHPLQPKRRKHPLTSTKQTFVTTGLDLLETCQATFLNINKWPCQTTTLKVPRPLLCIRILVNSFLRANSLNHPSGSLYNHNSLTSSSSLGSHSTLTCIILRLHTNRKRHGQKGGANIQSVPSKQTCTDVLTGSCSVVRCSWGIWCWGGSHSIFTCSILG